MSDEMMVEDGGGRVKPIRVNYPSNSKTAKNEPQRPIIEKAITGNVVQRKKPLLNRLGSSMVAEGSESVGQYIVMEVLLPAAKNMISDAVSEGINRLLFGDSRPRKADPRSGYTSYNRVKPSTNTYQPSRDISPRARANHDFNDFMLESRGEAEYVLDRLRDLISTYGAAQVSDLYDLLGVTGSFTDDRWGWSDLTNARVRMIKGGYLLELPRTEPLE